MPFIFLFTTKDIRKVPALTLALLLVKEFYLWFLDQYGTEISDKERLCLLKLKKFQNTNGND